MDYPKTLLNYNAICRVQEHYGNSPTKWKRRASKTGKNSDFLSDWIAAWHLSEVRLCSIGLIKNTGLSVWDLAFVHGELKLLREHAAALACFALAAWDDCAYILDLPPDAVKLLAVHDNPQAILLYPAVLAMYEGD